MLNIWLSKEVIVFGKNYEVLPGKNMQSYKEIIEDRKKVIVEVGSFIPTLPLEFWKVS
jgi:hypothetical protein